MNNRIVSSLSALGPSLPRTKSVRTNQYKTARLNRYHDCLDPSLALLTLTENGWRTHRKLPPISTQGSTKLSSSRYFVIEKKERS